MPFVIWQKQPFNTRTYVSVLHDCETFVSLCCVVTQTELIKGLIVRLASQRVGTIHCLSDTVWQSEIVSICLRRRVKICGVSVFAVQFSERCLLLHPVCIPERKIPNHRRDPKPQYRRILKKPLSAKQHQFATAHLEHKLSSGILVNLSFINRIPRAVLPVLWQERRVIIVRDDSMTSKGKTKQTASHIKERRRLLNSDSSANGWISHSGKRSAGRPQMHVFDTWFQILKLTGLRNASLKECALRS